MLPTTWPLLRLQLLLRSGNFFYADYRRVSYCSARCRISTTLRYQVQNKSPSPRPQIAQETSWHQPVPTARLAILRTWVSNQWQGKSFYPFGFRVGLLHDEETFAAQFKSARVQNVSIGPKLFEDDSDKHNRKDTAPVTVLLTHPCTKSTSSGSSDSK